MRHVCCIIYNNYIISWSWITNEHHSYSYSYAFAYGCVCVCVCVYKIKWEQLWVDKVSFLTKETFQTLLLTPKKYDLHSEFIFSVFFFHPIFELTYTLTCCKWMPFFSLKENIINFNCIKCSPLEINSQHQFAVYFAFSTNRIQWVSFRFVYMAWTLCQL